MLKNIEINDTVISKIFYGNRQLKYQLIKKYLNNTSKEYRADLHEYLINRYKDSDSIKETLYRIKHNIECRPVCLTCGGKVKFIGGSTGYTSHCSKKCTQQDKQVRELRLNTSIEKYGAGCNISKMKSTCLEKYGVENVYQTNWCKDKIKQTMFEHYGVDNYYKSVECRTKVNSKDIISKRIETKRQHGTFNTSKPEEHAYEKISKIFPDVIRQYKDERYPYCCDFYIPSIDTFIECNYFWMHGKHFYDRTNPEDVSILNMWKIKQVDNPSYKQAIYTWTILDKEKHETALKNNINYIVVWNEDDLLKWLIKLVN